MSSSSEPGRGFLALRDRAVAFIASHGPVDEPTLLAHVYGGASPPALRSGLVAPLLGDPRLEKTPDGTWSLGHQNTVLDHRSSAEVAFTSIALATSSSNPARGRIVRLAAQLVQGGRALERFTATLNPGRRVPRYVADRLHLAADQFDDLPAFGTILDDLTRFLGTRPLLAQDVRLVWTFLEAEARREGVALAEPPLVDVNELAVRLLELKGKPTLAAVAANLGIGSVRVSEPDEEVRVLGLVGLRLFAMAVQQDAEVAKHAPRSARAALQRPNTAHELPDAPGVYVMRTTDQTPLYVGKARRLRSRVAAYVNRPLGATRRLEGLLGAVQAVDITRCDTDLEALVLEDRQIRRLQPRFNTVRQQRAPRIWIRLPPLPDPDVFSKRQPAPRRLEPSLGPSSSPAGDFVGPFRNEAAAQRARLLARDIFELDALRRAGDQREYEARLAEAWEFLHGRSEQAEQRARLRSTRLLRTVLAFELHTQLLPADPRHTCYAVVRPGPEGIEGFLLVGGLLRSWAVLRDDDTTGFAAHLLTDQQPRTTSDDVDVVLRWLGAQRPPARVVFVPDDRQSAADAIEDAALLLLPGWLGET